MKEGRLYVTRALLVFALALLVAAVVPSLWSLRKPADKEQMTATVVPATPAEPAALGDGSIAVRDENGQLVGQLTRMPTDPEHAAIGTTSVDPTTGKELMNIISKY